MRKSLRFLVAGVALFAGLPSAQAQIYKVTLTPQNEIPPTASSATGSAIITLNSTTHEMRVVGTFSNLVGNSTAAHVHCCLVQPANTPVATTTPSFPGFPLGVRSGSFDRTYDMRLAATWNAPFITGNGGTPAGAEAAFIAGVAAGQAYLNYHSSTFGGGEIRGFLVRNVFANTSGLSDGAKNAATVLDTLGAGTGLLSNALVSLVSMSATSEAAAIEKLTPQASRGARVVAAEFATSAFDQVSDHVGALRVGDDKSFALLSGLNGLSGADNGVWASIYGLSGRQGRDGNFAGYKNAGWSVTGGYDHELESEAYIGALVSYGNSIVSYRNQSNGDKDKISSTLVSLYASKDFSSVYVDGMIGYAWQKYKSRRDTGISGIAGSAYNGHLWGLRVGGGAPLAVSSSVSLTPQVRVDWDSVKQDAYTETGGGPMALTVAAKSADRFRGSLGAQVDFAGNSSDVRARPYVRVFWQHDFQNGGLDSSATFASGGAAFVTPGQKLASDQIAAGVGLILYAQHAFSAAVTYDATLAKDYVSHAYQAKARWSF